MTKKLTKSNNKVIFGVCGGLADYTGIDATVVRLVYVLLTVLTSAFPGLLIYIIAGLVIPSPEQQNYSSTSEGNSKDAEKLKSANINESSESKEVPHTDDEFNDYFKK